MKVVFPEPEGPTRKTNSPLSISTEKSPRATVDPLYVLVTFSNLIMRQVSRRGSQCAERAEGTDRRCHSGQCYPAAIAGSVQPL